MSSIIISSDVPSIGDQIAKEVAEILGYEYLGPAFLSEISNKHNTTESELKKSIGDDLSYRGLLFGSQEIRLAYIQSAVFEQLQKDSIVCQGLGAHLYIRGISHILNVRILSDLRTRINQIAADKNISPSKVRKNLEKGEKQQKRWSMMRFGIDELNPSVYDVVFSLSNIEIDRVINTVTTTIQDRRYQAMTYSKKMLQDKALASKVRMALFKYFPEVGVEVNDGTVKLHMKGILANRRKKFEKAKKLTEEITGVEYVEIRSGTAVFGNANAGIF